MSVLRWVRLLGLVELAFVALLGLASPYRIGPLPAGMRTPVLAFELARDSAEIERMFGPPSSSRDRWVSSMRLVTAIDYLFLLVYGAFLACAARLLDRDPHRRRPLQAALALACMAPVADAIENACMLSILSGLGGDYAAALRGLAVATWSKWFALAACVACLSPALLRQPSRAARAAATFGMLAVPLSLAGLAIRGVFAEAMFACDALCSIGIWTWSMRDSSLDLSHTA